MARIDHPVMLVVLDGWGYTEDTEHNAIRQADTPVWDRLWAERPHMLVGCSGRDVGLPDGQMGNSEVGHMHIGAGRIVNQELTRIGQAIADGEFARNPVLRAAFARAAAGGTSVHVMGLLSPGGVHSHEEHILEIVRMAVRCGVAHVHVHGFLDGRDTPPKSAAASLHRVEQLAAELGTGRIASIAGRYYAMDRNRNWDRTRIAYELLVDGRAPYTSDAPLAALEQAYARGETDEFVQPTAVHGPAEKAVVVRDDDVVVFANFRADRARQLSAAFTRSEFDGFTRHRVPALGGFLSLTDYGDGFDTAVIFPPVDLVNTFGAVVAGLGLRQLRIAETEKYAHVTFFFNGGAEQPFPGEDRILVPSPAVATYDSKPEMSAAEVTDKLVDAICSRAYDAIICNFANADMVGHTGDLAATVKAIEALDRCLGRLLEAARETGLEILLTADHGNAEQMWAGAGDGGGQPHTAHTGNHVPLVYVGRTARLESTGSLADIAPTMLTLMGLAVPREMTGRPLVKLQDTSQHAA